MFLERLKRDKQTHNSSLVNLKYLYQFTAIPNEIRTEFLNKLLKRSNSSQQKNVQLLKMIYHHIENDKLSEWNDDKICLLLKISRNMLHCHKSRLLKSIRLYYFRINGNNNLNLNKNSANDFDTAVKINSLGMCKEAKQMFLNFEKQISGKKRKTLQDKYRLLLTARYLYQFYVYTENARMRQYYLNLGLKLCRNVLALCKRIKDRNTFNEVLILRHYFLAFKSFQNKKKIRGQRKALKHFKCALTPAIKNKNYAMYCQTLGNVAYHNLHLKNHDESEKNINKAFEIASKHDVKGEELSLESIDINCRNRTKKQSESVLRRRFKNLLEKLSGEEINPGKKMNIYTNLLPVASTHPERRVFYRFLYDMNSLSIITYGYKYSYKMLYVGKLLYCGDNIFNFKKTLQNGSTIPVVSGIDNLNSDKLEMTLAELNIKNLKISDLYFLKEVYLYSMLQEIIKGTECNPDYCEYIVRQIEWLNKSRGRIMTEYNNIPFDIMKLLLKMLMDLPLLSRNHFLDKYLMKFESSFDSLLSQSDNITLEYSLHSFTAELTNYKEVQDVITKIYPKLYKKYKKTFDDMINRNDKKSDSSLKPTQSKIRVA